jgi:hypothetical protein
MVSQALGAGPGNFSQLRGWTTPQNAHAYETIVRNQVILGIEARIEGFRHIDLLRRPRGEEMQFATIMWLDDLAAVKRSMGDDYEASHVRPRHERCSRVSTSDQPTMTFWTVARKTTAVSQRIRNAQRRFKLTQICDSLSGRWTARLTGRIGLSVWSRLAQLALFCNSLMRTIDRFDPVLKFTIS